MRFEYCCDAMLATLVEGVAVIYENGIEFDGGITLNYCPFCGKKVEFVKEDKEFVTTKDAIEEYVRQRICDYLDVLLHNDCFQRIYDGSGYDSAIEDVCEVIDEAIKELREAVENVSDEEVEE